MPQCEYKKSNLFNLPRKIDQIHLLNDIVRVRWRLFDITAANVAIRKREIPDSAPAKSNSRQAPTLAVPSKQIQVGV
jgi:hypothetical protein